MERRYYVVISNENEHGDHQAERFSDLEEADQAAKLRKGKLYEYQGKQLGIGEDHEVRGKLIGNYS